MTIIHNKNSSIGYDTVNRCITPVRTVKNTSYETMFKICIEKLIKGQEIDKYKNALINLAKGLDKDEV